MVTSTREMKEENMCDLELGKARVKKALESDYATWCSRTEYDIDAEKRYQIIFTEGSNYIKVVRLEESNRKSVVGFIVKKANKGISGRRHPQGIKLERTRNELCAWTC